MRFFPPFQLYITKHGHAIDFPGRCVPVVVKDLTEKLDESQVCRAGVSKRRAGIEEIPETRSSFDETTWGNL